MKNLYFMMTSRVLVVLTMLFCGLTSGFAQVSTTYTFSQNAGTYTALATSTVVHAAGWDDNVAVVAIPFTFVFNGTGYIACNVSSNGFITFGATAPTTTNYTPISSAATYSGAISAMGRDMITNASTIVYGTEGVAPNRTFVVQWNDARRYNLGAIAGNWNFQIRLSETSNIITVRYGACAASNTTNLTAEVGLRGATNGDFNNRNMATNTAWLLNTAAGGVNTASVRNRNTALPATGTTFVWTPLSVSYQAQLVSMATGSVNWCTGETRNVSITIKNNGTLPWTDGANNFQVGVKWNADPTYVVNVDAANLAAGATATYNLSVTAPATPGTNNLTFDVGILNCPLWFGTNATACAITVGPGNTAFVSPAQTIKARPVVNAGVDDTICPAETATLNGSATAPTVFQTALFETFGAGALPGGWGISSDGGYTPNVLWRHSAVDNPGGILTTTNANGYMNVDSDWWGTSGMAAGNAYLVMPSLNLSSYTSVNFSMSHYYRHNGTSSGTLQMSTNGGTIWTDINMWTANSANPDNYSVTIPAAIGQANVIFRFRYSGGWDWYWAVDDIVISGNAAAPLTYAWTPGPLVSNPTITNPTTSPPITTNYTLTATADGCASSDMMTIVVEDCSGLPVELSSFSASCEDGYGLISWATESEQDCDYFQVEMSRDGQTDWQLVGTKPGAGDSHTHLEYSIVDENAVTGTSYYRLNQVDTDGATKVYGPISLHCGSDGNVKLYPNPAITSFTMEVDADYPENLVVRMVDATGRVLLEGPWYVKKGTNQFPVDDLWFGTGVYFVSLIKEDGSSFIKKDNKQEPTLQVIITKLGFDCLGVKGGQVYLGLFFCIQKNKKIISGLAFMSRFEYKIDDIKSHCEEFGIY